MAIYSSNSENNMIFEIKRKTFSYFTLGNLGVPIDTCGYTDYFEVFDRQKIQLECKDGHYLSSLNNFGLLYKRNRAYHSKSSAKA